MKLHHVKLQIQDGFAPRKCLEVRGIFRRCKSCGTIAESTGRVTITTHQHISNSHEQRYKGRRIVISTLQDDIMLSFMFMTNPGHILIRLKNISEVQNSSRILALREEFFSLQLHEGNNGNKPHLEDQFVGNQLVGNPYRQVRSSNDGRRLSLVLNSQSRSWVVF